MGEEGKSLLDHEAPLAARMRDLFFIRSSNSTEGRKILIKALKDTRNSTLLRHEVAFALGQMQELDVAEDLMDVLKDFDDDIVVRHEAAEALGAIGAVGSLGLLKECFQRDQEAEEVRETCELSIKRINGLTKDGAEKEALNMDFNTVDPTATLEQESKLNVPEMEKILLDESQPLSQRYKAMFSLRNLKSDEATLSLAKGLKDSKSALFRHEVAFVLGQLEREVAFDALRECLENTEEHDMVRHEAAEAIGAITSPEATETLRKFAADDSQIVRESCQVALDAKAYWKEFENGGESQNPATNA